MLTTEFQYYIDNQLKLAAKYSGKFIVIVGNDVVGVYDTIDKAYNEPQSKYELGTFLIQEAITGEQHYTHTINRYIY